ncbi:MAG: DUF2723 domain-containing protein [Planctomycetes bacterium]|nr:DUF2723 domain-containing protein [Planctomycetota bacterium]
MSATGDRLRPLLFAPIRFRPLVRADASALRLALIPAATAFIVFLVTLPSAITGEHAGELVAAAALDGVPHPPGHALWTLGAGITLKLVPFGTQAWRAALFSAIAAALACGLLAVWLRQQDVGRRAAVIAALFLAFGGASWGQAVVPAVHALTLFLMSALLVLVTQAAATGRARRLPAAAFVAGLGVTHHPAFWGIAAAAALLLAGRRPAASPGARVVAACAAAFAAGLLPLLYLPHLARDLPYVNSGALASVADAFRHLFDRGTPSVPWGAPDLLPARLDEAAAALQAMAREHLWIGVPFAVLGLRLVAKRSRADLLALMGLIALPTAISIYFGEQHGGAPPADIGARILPAMFAIAALAGIAIDAPLQRFGNAARLQSWLWNAGAACLPLLLLVSHFGACNYANYRYASELAAAILDPLPKNAILFTSGDFTTYPLLYHHGVLGARPDVELPDRCGEIDWDRLPALNGLRARGRPLEAGLAIPFLIDEGTHRVYSTAPTPHLDLPYRWEPAGLIFRARSYDGNRAEEEAAVKVPFPRFTQLPEEPPAEVSALGGKGAPFDAAARQVAILYYGALARRHNAAGDIKRSERAAEFVHRLRRGD